MSGAADDRSSWRGGRAFDQNRQSGQRQPNSRTMSAHGGSRGGQQSSNTSHTSWADEVTAASQDQHTPVGGFNAAEAKTALRRAPKPYFYKAQGKDANNRASGPWGSNPNTMASGKDFFLELRKQVTALRQGGSVAGG
ncbi:predicted protein [Aspergillus nidulans FGSC A4]|uniref:Uncharacterized protein n=1 Tax=Emericella nidulans (strain FGSC A4 / ATCC 38163 / CBS 112.46 / NRRL 194 / M139) TaxID=227321 RepID=Q5AYF6_EMENI|nr:hypothetical protein [Aspergillus nidulans FGSC A4]EAA57617.1 predicted protein [Aspergillus nidulans FGSC A4]CBF71224.1 TPA: conserved hypothetical protein [Aspergillus nidulans FGSC A4]|eukprot:XP_664278.1 predicted protein [Aspergillus nidulans FGSC A4]